MRKIKSNRARGFTLIELLVGVTISTFILGAAAGAFVSTLRSWERGSNTYETLQLAQTLGDLIERHLRSAIDPSDGAYTIFWGLDLSDETTSGHELIFSSTAPGRFPRSAPLTHASEIGFTLDPAEGDGFKMRIDSSPDDYQDDGGYVATFSELITDFKVTYFDGEEWVDEWFELTLPMAVEFRLTLIDRADFESNAEEPRTYQVSRLVSLPMGKPLEEAPLGEQGGQPF